MKLKIFYNSDNPKHRELVQRITETVDWLSLLFPYTVSFIKKMSIELVDGFAGSIAIPTAATDCKKVYVNVDWCLKLSREELAGTLLHEALHAALRHCDLREKSYPGIWNIATDCVINYFILEKLKPLGSSSARLALPQDLHQNYEKDSNVSLPSGVITPEIVAKLTNYPVDEIKKMSAEEIYYLLLRNAKIIKVSTADIIMDGCGKCRGSSGKEGGSSSQNEKRRCRGSGTGKEEKQEKEGGGEQGKQKRGSEDKEKKEGKGGKEQEKDKKGKEEEGEGIPNVEDVRDLVERFGVVAGLTGTDVAEIHQALDTLPKTDWRKVLRNLLSKLTKGGYRYTWKRESRKLGESAMGRIKCLKPKSPLIYLLIDVSGSVVGEPNVLKNFLGEVVNIAKQLKASIHVVTWDTEVVDVFDVDGR